MKRRIKTIEKPKRRRIMRKKKVKRRRIKNKKMVICGNHKCWFEGTCPHKKPHVFTEKCEQDFCSLINIRTGCVEYKKEK